MNNYDYYFDMAAKFACRRQDRRAFMIGAVGVRNDGVIVVSRNSSAHDVTPDVHAEARLCNKMTTKSVVYVARWLRSGGYANAKPCPSCELRLRALGVKKAYYTIENNEHGVINFC